MKGGQGGGDLIHSDLSHPGCLVGKSLTLSISCSFFSIISNFFLVSFFFALQRNEIKSLGSYCMNKLYDY